MATNFKARLKKMKKGYTEQKQTAKDMFTKVPAGVYVGTLISAVVKESSSGNLMIARKHLITEGDETGTTVSDNKMLENDLGFAFVIGWIELCGYEAPDNPEDIEGVLSAMVEEELSVKFLAKHSGNFINAQVQELLSTSDKFSSSGDDNGDDEGDEAYTADDINELNKPDLIELINDNKLKFDPNGKKIPEIRQGIIDELGLEEKSEEVDEEEEEEITAEEINGMKRQELVDLIEANDLDANYEEIKAIKTLRKTVIEELGLAEAKGEEADEEEAALRKFCDEQELGEFKTKKEMIDEIAMFEWPEDAMDAETITLFEAVGLEHRIKRAKVAEAAPRKIIKRKKA